jgi:hypothetical protein
VSRARNIKPGFFKNDKLAECEPLARLLFAALWCEADREGRLEDRPKRIKAECLPYDDADVDALLGQLAEAGFIIRYEVEGAKYIAVVNFAKHQMPHHKEVQSVIPPPPGQPAITRHAYDVSADLRLEIFARDGNRCLCCGTDEQLSLDHIVPLSKGGTNDESNLQTLCRRCNSAKGDAIKSYIDPTLGQRKANVYSSKEPLDALIPDSLLLIPDSLKEPPQPPASGGRGARRLKAVPEGGGRFGEFWQAYPRKVAKPAAEKAWRKVAAEADSILAGLRVWAGSDEWAKDGGQFIPHPATFLNQRRWEDRPKGASAEGDAGHPGYVITSWGARLRADDPAAFAI